MFFEVGCTKIALHDGIAPQVQHAQHTVADMNQQLTSIRMQTEGVDDVTLQNMVFKGTRHCSLSVPIKNRAK